MGRKSGVVFTKVGLIMFPGGAFYRVFSTSRCGDRWTLQYEDQVAGWACDRRLEACSPNGRPMILEEGAWLPICLRWPVGYLVEYLTADRGALIRTCLEISKTPVVGSDLSSGVAG